MPSRKSEPCSMCGLCENACPTGAMDHIKGVADPSLCITCLRCVDICPDKMITINSTKKSWPVKLSMSKTTEQELNKQVGKLYV